MSVIKGQIPDSQVQVVLHKSSELSNEKQRVRNMLQIGAVRLQQPASNADRGSDTPDAAPQIDVITLQTSRWEVHCMPARRRRAAEAMRTKPENSPD